MKQYIYSVFEFQYIAPPISNVIFIDIVPEFCMISVSAFILFFEKYIVFK